MPDTIPATISDINSTYKLVHARHGLFLANSVDFYIGKALIDYGEYGEIELQLLLQLVRAANSTIVEIGANIGTHTVPLAKALEIKGLDLIAFEPQQFVFQNLCANLALNNISNARVFPLACGDKACMVWFKKPDYNKKGNFGGVKMHEKKDSAFPTQSVQCVRLDDVLSSVKISVLKIDVEGFEKKVLQGGEKVIASNRPIIYVENSELPAASKELIEYLWSLDYKLFWHHPKLYNPLNFFRNPLNPYPTVASVNMLCLPGERKQNIQNLEEVLEFDSNPLYRKANKNE